MRRLLPLVIVLLTACQVEYHPYDTRISGETGINARNAERIESTTTGKEQLCFAVISDTQRWHDETSDAVAALNRRDDLDFVIHAGDVADFGMRFEFELQRDILNRLDVPYVVVVGNHDCLASGEEVFRKVFGEFNFAFTAGDTRFLCLNTNALEFDRTESVPNFGFLDMERENYPAECSKTIVVMHAPPLSDQFDNGVAKIFQLYIRSFAGLQCCIHGHGHSYKVQDLFGDGTIYWQCEHIAERNYLVFTVNKEGYDVERVFF